MLSLVVVALLSNKYKLSQKKICKKAKPESKVQARIRFTILLYYFTNKIRHKPPGPNFLREINPKRFLWNAILDNET